LCSAARPITARLANRSMEPPTAAPYGHACANCVRSKCKCVIRQGKNTCERCSRLGKECLPATQVRKRGTRSTPVPKRAKLEDKLDSLVTLLQVQNSNVPQVSFQQDSNSIGPDQTPSLRYNKVVSGQAKPVGNTREFHPSQQTHLDSLYYEVAPPTNFSASSSISTLNSAASSDGTLSLDERPPPRYDSAINSELKDLDNLPAVDRSSRTDGQTLQFFRTSYLPNFPCVILPPDGSLDTESFKRSNPFLWRNIQAVCEPSLDRLRDLGVQIREYAARKVVVEGERSLDFLTGLLIHVSWYVLFSLVSRCK
jgi:hypothetical protein